MNIFAALISPIAGYFGKREERKKEVKLKQIDRLQNSDDALSTWEEIQAENSRYSWKDEFWTVVLSAPAILCFIPGFDIYVVAGFSALAKMPDFYQYWLGVAVLTSFGVRIKMR